jgi:chromosome segregation ATPase
MSESEASPPEPPPAQEDFRQKQIHELEQLQAVLDENNLLRGKYNALQAQVAPLVDSFAPGQVPTYQSERVYTPEEIEALKQKLEQALSDYREETRIAGRLNSEIERKYTELSGMRMRFRLEQADRLARQNQSAAVVLAKFRVKSVKVVEANDADRNRLVKAVGYLRNVYNDSTHSISECDTQNKSNNRGIQQLSAQITLAKEDIRDYADQLQKIQPKLREYEALRERHQQVEEQVVQLSDEFEGLKKQIETESLTARIRRQIDAGNKTIADLNRAIDQVLNRTSLTQEKIAEARARTVAFETAIARTQADTAELRKSRKSLAAERIKLRTQLAHCRIAHETTGGENEMLTRDIRDGLTYGRRPWHIRKELLALRRDVREMADIEGQQAQFEAALAQPLDPTTTIPQRKRVRLISSGNTQ